MKKRIGLLLGALAIAASSAIPALAQFGAVSNGPIASTQCYAPTLGIDKSNGQIYACGLKGTWNSQEMTLYSLPAQTAVTAVTTAQNLVAFPQLNANFQNITGRLLQVCGQGVFTTAGTTQPTLTFALTEGGITPVSITTAATSATAGTSLPFQVCFNLTTVSTGATGTLEAHGSVNANIATAGSAISTFIDTNTAVSSAINLTAANTMALTVAASAAVTSVQLRQVWLEVLD